MKEAPVLEMDIHKYMFDLLGYMFIYYIYIYVYRNTNREKSVYV